MRDLLSSPLSRGIAAVLAIKLIALYALWAAFFSDPVSSDAQALARAVLPHPEAAAHRSEK